MARNKKKLLPSSIVTQSNELVSARYTLPLGEQRLLMTMISRIQPDDEDFKPYRISVSELADFLGVARGSAYNECKKITRSLLGRVLEINEPGRLLQTHWVSSADYVDGTGMVILTFDPQLKPYLLQLQGNFTSCKLGMLLSFKSQYTIRIYTFLKQHLLLKTREIELNHLREMMGLKKDQHESYKHFKSNILLPTQKELLEKSDLSFEFEEIKYGRKVGAIRFLILCKDIKSSKDLDSNNLSAVSNVEQAINSMYSAELLLLVPEQHRAKTTVISAINRFEKKQGVDYVKRNILYCNAKADKSYAGFLHNALTNDWGQEWELDHLTPVKKRALEIWERQGFASLEEYGAFMFRKQMEKYNSSS